MFGSFPSIVAAIALAIAPPLAHAQSGPGGVCGGLLTPGRGTHAHKHSSNRRGLYLDHSIKTIILPNYPTFFPLKRNA